MMAQFFRDINKDSVDKRTLFESCVNRVRVFALMLREPAVQGFASQWVSAISNFIGWSEFLDMVISTPEFPNPKWLTTLFLILETYLAQKEDNPDENSTLVLEHHEATRLLSYCIQLLKLDTLSEDNLLATLRILIRLTKHRSMAQEFLAHEDGLEALLARPKRRFESHFKVQQAYVIIILRHLIETEQVVIECIREWMVAYANEHPNQRTSVDKFAKRGQAAFLRSPTCFFKLVKQMYRCGINYGNSSVRFVGSTSGEDHLVTIDESRKVIHFLLKELVKVQATKEESNWKLGYTGYLVECLLELVSSYPSCKQDMISFEVPKDIEFHYTPDMVPHSDRSIVYVLLNILVPYGAMNARTDLERKKKGIYIWTTGLLVAMCYDTMHASNTREHEERQEGDNDEHLEQENEEQSHATEEIQQVGQGSTEHQETVSTKREDVLAHVRSHVLQAIAGCFEYYTVTSAKRSSKKYLKYYSLSELCHHILNARPAAINPDYIPPASNKDANVVALSKLMLENNFVPLLVNAIQDVDANYPHAKTILNALLRPLERLTKTAARLPPDAVHIPEIEQEGNITNEEDEEDQEDDYRTFRRSESPVEEVDEIYRNSSLAMLDSTVVEDEEDMEGSTDESSEDEDVEMASSGEEVIEIVEEADDESSDNETMPDDQEEEDEEDREMDELMRSHRHHLPDTDEEVDDDIEESLHEDEDGSVESYDPDDDSDLMGSDVSDDVESEDDRDWRLTTNEVPRDRSVTNDRQVGEGQDTEDIQSEAGVQSYDFSLRRRYAGGFRSRVTINTQNNLFDMPAVTMAFTAENEARLRPEYSSEKDDIILHPLLRGTNQQTINGLKEVFERDRSLSNLQPYEDIIGHGPLFMLKSIVASQAQQQKDYEEDRALEIGPTFQFTADDNAPSVSEPSKDKDDKYVLRLLLGFTPMPTIDRWTQVAQMVFIPSIIAQKTVELADRLTTILLADNQESRAEEARGTRARRA
ncbi:hypothetical protein RMATCC62417_18380 [Rhizopus microsporus]|nr:hypothetical protein RMATCC62417_18380 [Rhizopus microsporus]